MSQRAVAKPSSYQMFVKTMTQQLQQQHPENKQAENMRKIGELWRNMPPEERERYAQEAQAAHEQAQAQQGAFGIRAGRRLGRQGLDAGLGAGQFRHKDFACMGVALALALAAGIGDGLGRPACCGGCRGWRSARGTCSGGGGGRCGGRGG